MNQNIKRLGMFPAQVWVCYPRPVYQHSPCLNERHGSGVSKHPEGEMKVCRKGHWKPQSPVREGGVVYGHPTTRVNLVSIRDLEKLEEVYKKYKARLDYLYKLYAQGVPVVVPSTTSIPIQTVPSTIPDPAFPSQSLQILVPSTI